MADITLSKPVQGQRQVVQSAADSRIVLDFPAAQATMEKVNDNLVFRFDDGGSVELENFYQQFNKDSIPEFQVDGQLIAGADFFNAFGPDLAPAAGPGSTQGGSRYREWASMNLADGIDHLNELDWGMQTGVEYSDNILGESAPPLPTGIGMSWVDSWPGGPTGPSGPGGDRENTGAWAEGGRFVLKESWLSQHGQDGLGYDKQGTRHQDQHIADGTPHAEGDGDAVQASAILRITTQNSEFTGLTIDGQFRNLAQLTGGVNVGLDLDNDGEFDVEISFVYQGRGDVLVTVTLDHAVSHIDNLGALLDEAISGLGIIAHNNAGDTAGGALSVVVVDDNPEAYDDWQSKTAEATEDSGMPPTSRVLGVNKGDNVFTVFTGNVITGQGDQGKDGQRTGLDLIGADGLADPAELSPVVWKTDQATTGNAAQPGHAEQAMHTDFYLVAGAPHTFTVMDSNGDENGDKVVGEIVLGSDGAYTFTLNIDYEPEHGQHTINIPYTLTDGDGDTADAVLHLTIENVNDRPVFVVPGQPDNPDGPLPPDPDHPGTPGDPLRPYDVAGAGAVKETGVWGTDGAARDNNLHDGTKGFDDENAATQAGGSDPGQHRLTANGQLRATDADSDLLTFGPGAPGTGQTLDDNGDETWTFHSQYGDLTIRADGSWTFELNDGAANHLAEGDKAELFFPVTVTDNSGAVNDTATAHILILVHGTNDKPTLTVGASLNVDESGDSILVNGQIINNEPGPISVGGQLSATDPDDGASLTFGFVMADNKVVTAMYLNSAGNLVESAPADGNYYGAFTMNAASGEYVFTLNNSAPCVQALNVDDHRVFTIPVAVRDEFGAYDKGSFSVTINGANDAPFITGGTTGAVKEDGVYLPAPGGEGNTPTTDANDAAPNGLSGLADDKPHHELIATGQLQAADVDDDPSALTFGPVLGTSGVTDNNDGSWTMEGLYGTLLIRDNGSWTYTLDPAKANALNEGQTETETFPVTVGGPHGGTGSGAVAVTVRGTNDVPELSVEKNAYSFTSSHLDTTSTIYVDKGFSGEFNIADPDTDGQYSVTGSVTDNHLFELSHLGQGRIGGSDTTPDIHSNSGGYGDTVTVLGTYGALTVNLSTGEYKYDLYPHPDHALPGMENRLLVDQLQTGDTYREVFTLTVKDLHGAHNTQEIAIDIFGTYNAPYIKSFVHDVYEDKIKYYDVDGNILDEHGRPLVDDNPRDGKPDIENADAPISIAGNALAGHQLGDGTAAQHLFRWDDGQGSIANGAGTVATPYGVFTANADGAYTFTLVSSNPAVQALGIGDTREVKVTYTYMDKEGHEAHGSATIIIHGANDGPTVSHALAAVNTAREDGYPETGVSGAPNTFVDSPDTIGDYFIVADPDANDKHRLEIAFGVKDGASIDIGQLPADADGFLQPGFVSVDVEDPATGKVIGKLTVTADKLADGSTRYSYSFTLDQAAADYLNEGQKLEYALTYTVTDLGGESVTQSATITVLGTNDRPVLDLANPRQHFEEGVAVIDSLASRTFEGTFQVTDIDADGGTDNPRNTFSGDNGAHWTGPVGDASGNDLVLQGQYGTLTVHSDGTYEYVLDTEIRNGQTMLKIDALGEDVEYTEHFDIIVRDIHGTWSEKAPVEFLLKGKNSEIIEITDTPGALNLKEAGVAVDASGTGHDGSDPYTEKTAVPGVPTATENNKFVVFDPDRDDVRHLVLTIDDTDYDLGNGSTAGNVTTYTLATAYGSITVTGTAAADGVVSYKYTYELDNAKTATNALSEGQSVTQNCVITVDDGHGSSADHSFTVTIEGTNDTPRFDMPNCVVTGAVRESGVYAASTGNYNTAGDVNPAENTATQDGDVTPGRHRLEVSGNLRATDADSDNDGSGGTPTLVFALTADHATTVGSIINDYGTLTMQPDGRWTFVLDDTPGGKADQLYENQSAVFTFTATVTDNHGATAETTITVTVIGSNDQPVLTVAYPTADLDADGNLYVRGDDAVHQSVNGTLAWTDIDSGDMAAGHDIRIVFTDNTDPLNPVTTSKTDTASSAGDNHLEIEGKYGTLFYDRGADGAGTWHYELDYEKSQALVNGQVVEEKFTFTARDRFGAYDSQTLVINVVGTEESSKFDLVALQPSQTVIEAGVAPDMANLHYQWPTYVDDPGQPEADGRIVAVTSGNHPGPVTYSVLDKDNIWHKLGDMTDSAYDSFSGAWIISTPHGTVTITENTVDGGYDYHYELNNIDPYVDELNVGDRGKDSFKVQLVDNYNNTAEANVNISIVGVNDRPDFVGDNFEAQNSEDYPFVFTGILDTRDPDSEDRGSVETGAYNLKVTGLINVPLEQNGAFGDLDEGEPSGMVLVPGWGLCVIKADGSYTFELSEEGKLRLQSLDPSNPLEILVPVRVTDPQGAYTNEVVTITLVDMLATPALNPAPKDMDEDGWASAPPLVYDGSGGLAPNPAYHAADRPDSVTGNLVSDTSTSGTNHGVWVYSIVGGSAGSHNFGSGTENCMTLANQYGALYLASDGRYEFVLNNDAPATQSLKPGQQPDMHFTVEVTDSSSGKSSTGDLKITVHGANDRPELDVLAHDLNSYASGSNWAEFHDLDAEYRITGHFNAKDWDNLVYRAVGDASSNLGTGGTVQNSPGQPYPHAEESAEVVFCFLALDKDHNVVPVQTVYTQWGSVTINADTGEYAYHFNVNNAGAQAALEAAISGGGKLHDEFTVYARDVNGAYSEGYTVKVELGENARLPGTWTPGNPDPNDLYQPPNTPITVTPSHVHEDGWGINQGTDHFDPATDVTTLSGGDKYTGHQSTNYGSNGDPAFENNMQIEVHGRVGGNVDGRYYYFIVETKDAGGNVIATSHVQSVPALDDQGNVYGHFSINPKTGEYVFILDSMSDIVQKLDGGQVVDIVDVKIGCADRNPAGAYYSTPGEIDLPFQVIGTSDRPSFHGERDVYETPAEEAAGQADPNNYGNQTVTGKLEGSDRDKDDSNNLTFSPTDETAANVVTVSSGNWVIHGQYGDLALAADGTYTYTVKPGLNIPHDSGWRENFAITVTDDGDFAHNDPLSSNGSLIIHLHGQNTPPTATVTNELTVREDDFNGNDLVLSNVGNVADLADYDGDQVSVSIGTGGGAFGSYATGGYGTLFLRPDGTFYYQLNNDLRAVQELKPGGDRESLSETFVVRLDDGHGGVVDKTVTVNINGDEDRPFLALLGGEDDDIPGAGRSLDMLKTDTDGVHGKALVFDVDYGDAQNALFSLHGVGSQSHPQTDDEETYKTYTADDGKTWALLNGAWVHIGDFSINASGEYAFIPTDGMQALGVGEQISFDIRIWVNGGRTNDNGTSATVTVTVTGTNTVPIITGNSPSVVVEDDPAHQQVSGQVLGVDPDAVVGELHYTVLTGNGVTKIGPTTWRGEYGVLKLNPDGSYTYTLDNAKAQPANVDNFLHDVFKVVATDGHGEKSQPYNLDVTIEGVNDVPVISNVTALPGVAENGVLTSNGSMKVADVDDALATGDFTVGFGNLPATANSGLSGSADGTYGTLTIDGYDPATGALTYHYDLDNAKAATIGHTSKTETFTILVDDGHGTLVKQVISVTVTGQNHPPVLNAVSGLAVTEVDVPADRGTVIGTAFTGSDPDNDTLTFVVTGGVATGEQAGYTHKVAGAYGTLYYNAGTGANKYVCNGKVQGGDTGADTFTVRAYDGHGGYSAGQALAVTVTGNADDPVVTITGNAILQAINHEDGRTKTILPMSIVDPDAGDHAEIRLSAGVESAGAWGGAQSGSITGTYGTLKVNAGGNLEYNLSQTGPVQALQVGEQRTETFTVWVRDDTGNLVVREVTFTVKGANDTPVISDVQSMAPVTEHYGSGLITSTGFFMVTDVDDALTTLTPAVVGSGTGSYGSLMITGYDSGTGQVTYTYTLDEDKARKLGAGQNAADSFTIRVTDGHGGYTDQPVSVTVNGSNDNPTISITGSTTVVEDAAHLGASASLALALADVDLNDAALTVKFGIGDGSGGFSTGALHGTYGTLTRSGGQLVYTVDRSCKTNTGQQETFTVRVEDGHGGYAEQQVTFTVTTFNELPTISVSGSGVLDIGNLAAAAGFDGNQLIASQVITGSVSLNISDAETATDDLLLQVTGHGGSSGAPGATVHGQYGDLVFAADGTYEYTFNGDLDTLRALAGSSGSLNDVFTVRVTDEEGQSSQTSFTVHIDADNLATVNDGSSIPHVYTGGHDDTYVLGTDDNDRITVSGGDNVIFGGDGDDVIRITGEGNQLFGGDGNDLFIVNPGSTDNFYSGGAGVDFLVSLQDMGSVDDLFASDSLEDIDVVLVGGGGSTAGGITNLGALASLGLTVDNGQVALDGRWTQDPSAIPANADGYLAFTTSVMQPSGVAETLTILVLAESLQV
ncbi:MAG: VCBS domain-containing protein [Desulfovibrio sp.]|jgi:VCBS repeat-containing protein|nr:VCBS domain-containing protein [Desulfovibrio sp.]